MTEGATTRTRVQMPVLVSRQQLCLQCLLFLLLLWPTASLLQGWQWGFFLPCWLAALWLAWRRALRVQGELIWDGEWLGWQGRRYRLGPRCRVLPGVLWLQLQEEGAGLGLWLFSDALAPEHYRALARAIHLAPPR